MKGVPMPITIEYHDVIGSTSDRAKELAASGVGNICVVANEQTAGRGRMGRSFFSPPGTGLYMSLVLPPDDPAMLTVAAAVFVSETLEEMIGEPVGIKWVNDILLRDRKICGILAEGRFGEDGRMRNLIVGIGINLRKTDFPPDLRRIAGDVETLTGKRPDRRRLLEKLVERFERWDGNAGTVIGPYRSRSVVIGKNVTVIRGSEIFEATALSVSDSGGLWVDCGGERRLLKSGEVSVRIGQEQNG